MLFLSLNFWCALGNFQPIKTDDGKLQVTDKQAGVRLFLITKRQQLKNGKLRGRKFHLIRVRTKELCSELKTIKLADYLHIRFRFRSSNFSSFRASSFICCVECRLRLFSRLNWLLNACFYIITTNYFCKLTRQ